MIPARLTISNFMGYREQIIAFEELPSPLLITGANGSGKSTIMHAITWALWEHGPRRASSELISWGAASMEVAFEFLIDQERYRVRRRYSRDAAQRKESATMLTFEVLQDEGFVLIGDDKAPKKVQAAITKRIGMDYPLFATAAYFSQRQGAKFDFAEIDPAQRLAKLSEILGNQFFESLAKTAKEEAQILLLGEDANKRRLEAIAAELGNVRVSAQKLVSVRTELALAEAVRNEADAAVREREIAVSLLESKNSMRAKLVESKSALEQQVSRSQESIDQQIARKEQIVILLTQGSGKDTSAAELSEVRTALKAMSELRDKAREILLTLTGYQHAREAEEKARKMKLESALAKLSQLPTLQVESERIQNRIAVVEQALLALAPLVEKEPQTQVDLEKRTADAEQAALLLQDLKTRGQTLTESLATLADASACPTCRQDLAGQRREEILTRVKTERDDLRERFRIANNDLLTARTAREALRTDIAQMQKSEREAAAYQAEQARLLEQQVRAQQGLAESAAAEQDRVSASLPVEVTPSEQDAQAQLEQLHYSETSYQALVEQAAVLEKRSADLASLERLRGEQDVLEGTLLEKQREHVYLLEQCERINSELAAQGAALSLTDATRELEQAKTKLSRAQSETQRLLEETHVLAASAGQLAVLLDRQRSEEKLREESESRRILAQELSFACSKKGVPWMIIQSVLPELDAEANEILGLLSDGDLRIEFLTAKENESGTTRETLLLNVWRDGHPHDFDLVSGGQAFRISFALRIALARLLARRAGTKLQMLFIDEGFGSQDAESRPRVVEAIHAISPLFAKVVVITHFPEIFEAFPHRLEVRREAEGSEVVLLG